MLIISLGTIFALMMPSANGGDSKTESPLRTITTGAGVISFGVFIQMSIAFFAKIIMARYLTVADYGSISIAIVITNVVATTAALGLDTGVARFIPRFNEDDRSEAVATSYGIALSVSMILGAGVFVFAQSISAQIFGSPEMSPVVRVMALGVPFWVLLDIGIGVTRGLGEAAPRVYTRNVILPASRFILVAIVVVMGLGVTGVASAYIASYALASIFITYLVLRRISWRGKSHEFDHQELVMFSIPLTFSDLSSYLYRNIDLALVGVILTTVDVGVYNVAYPVARLLLVVPGAFNFLFMPMFSALHSDNELERADEIYSIVTKWIVFLSAPVAVGIVFFPREILSILFGSKYGGGALVLAVLGSGFLVSNIAGMGMNALTGLGRSKVVALIDTFALVLNIGLNILLIPLYGILGAGMATVLTYIFRNFISAGYAYITDGLSPLSQSLGWPLGIALMFSTFTVTVRPKTGLNIVVFVIFIGVYGILIVKAMDWRQAIEMLTVNRQG